MKKTYLTLLIMLISPALFAQIYVTESGAGLKNGSSWANAYEGTKLQQAINEATSASVKQVWVAKGTYKPTEDASDSGTLIDNLTPTTNRDYAFIIKSGVEIYGGFAGNEGSSFDLSTRNFVTNETILSGDLNNNNVADDGDCYHVVVARSNTDASKLDGFTIQHGFANGPSSTLIGGYEIAQGDGAAVAIRTITTSVNFENLLIKDNISSATSGGVFLRYSDPLPVFTFNKVVFLNNIAGTSGGAAYINASSNGSLPVNFVNCTFDGNKGLGITSGAGGGAIFYTGNSSTDPIVNITDCKFINGTHSNYGAFIRVNAGTINITRTTFENGIASSWAGAIYSTTNAVLNLNYCEFNNNTGTSGGHLYVYNGKLNCVGTSFENGNAGNGAAIYNNGDMVISRSKFYHNTSSGTGGAIYTNTQTGLNSDVIIDNSIFYDNISKATGTAGAGGAVIYQTRGNSGELSNVKFINNTLYANKSMNPHGAYSFNGTANVKAYIYNNIFYKNLANYDELSGTGSEIANIRENTSTTAYIYLENNLFQTSVSNTGRISSVNNYLLNNGSPEPLFASLVEGELDFLWPNDASFAKDKGSNALYTANVADVNTDIDLLNHDRLSGVNIDLGAIEWSQILPVGISSFTAKLVNNRSQLNWTVGTEVNVNRYEVERSINGIDFEKIVTVLANGLINYKATDANPALGTNYYRLKVVDQDGSANYSGVVSVKVAELSAQIVSVYPNPVFGNTIKVSGLAAGDYSYQLISTSGAVVQQGMMNGNEIKVSGLKAGVYVLQLNNGITLKVIKQ